MRAHVRRWGNSLAIRIPADEAEALGLKEGDEVKVGQIQKVPHGKVDVSKAPFFRDPEGRTDLSVNHDDLIAEAVWDHLQEKKRRK